MNVVLSHFHLSLNSIHTHTLSTPNKTSFDTSPTITNHPSILKINIQTHHSPVNLLSPNLPKKNPYKSPQHAPTLMSQPHSPRTTKQPTDTTSMTSTSTIHSTVSLLKDKLTQKDRKAKKAMKAAAARSTLSQDGKVVSEETRWVPKDPDSRKSKPLPGWNARARTAEAYMIPAMTR
ncbi:hypothetical protein HYALB_00005582 [Hymenoscyphus albidus]|uniref:Uncharacterized protein n=1 Tax=Hymenoscyphus albidus TaxID=595503 RepID=A0A9N9LGY1_9HELO|nr:hypothetical protein HYALB_00005582 [Hymenoscyphus albidus]